MLCARALVRALNDAKNRAQQGCAMQFSGITLTEKKSHNVVCARAIVRALNDEKTHAQQGCAMQFSGITLT